MVVKYGALVTPFPCPLSDPPVLWRIHKGFAVMRIAPLIEEPAKWWHSLGCCRALSIYHKLQLQDCGRGSLPFQRIHLRDWMPEDGERGPIIFDGIDFSGLYRHASVAGDNLAWRAQRTNASRA